MSYEVILLSESVDIVVSVDSSNELKTKGNISTVKYKAIEAGIKLES